MLARYRYRIEPTEAQRAMVSAVRIPDTPERARRHGWAMIANPKHVEDLNITGMVRNRRLARVISDAGWAQFVRLLEEKAERYGRTVYTVSRWLPSSKTCSA